MGRKLGELDIYKFSFLGGTTLTPAHKLHVTHEIIVCRKGSGPDPWHSQFYFQLMECYLQTPFSLDWFMAPRIL